MEFRVVNIHSQRDLKMSKSFISAALFALLTSLSFSGVAADAQPVKAAQVAVAQSSLVDLNTADAETLTRELLGIGANKAKAIIEYREAHGAFTSVDDLLEVNGIGTATLEKNRSKIVVH